MAKTYTQLLQEIEQLSAEAEKLRAHEKTAAVREVRATIEAFGLIPQDLFDTKRGTKLGTGLGSKLGGNVGGKAGPNLGETKWSGLKTKASLSTSPKFTDGAGKFWVGRGKRPDWLRAALAAGRDLSEFAVGVRAVAPLNGTGAPTSAKSAKLLKPKKAAAKSSAKGAKTPGARYMDGAGNSWSGMGRMPKWLKTAVAGGKKLEELAA